MIAVRRRGAAGRFEERARWSRLRGVITGVQIEGFRGAREGGVEGLAPISILVGPNNTGKSTVLEAIAVAEMAPDAKAIAALILRRGGPALDALGRVVARGAKEAVIAVKPVVAGEVRSRAARVSVDDYKRIELALLEEARREGLQEPLMNLFASGSRGSTTVLVDGLGRISMAFGAAGGAPTAPTVKFVDVEAVRGRNALEDAYTTIFDAGQLGKVVKALSRAMPGLTDLRIQKIGPDFLLHTSHENGPPVPAYLAGDGFKRFLELAAATLNPQKGVVLLEEPESFQHPRYLQELSTLLHLAAREGSQVILSTHSIELIDLLLNAPEAEGMSYPAVHRLTLQEGKLRATTLDRERAVSVRDDLLQDLRA